jgi:diamine N-acetyltransferase
MPADGQDGRVPDDQSANDASAAAADTAADHRSVLRVMTRDDVDELVDVQREAAVTGLSHIFPQEEHPFPTSDVRARWGREVDDPGIDCFVVLAGDGQISGFAATRGDEFLHFGTALSTWGSGLAGRAHDEIVDHLLAQGHERSWLRVFEQNHRARRFYERRGWTATGSSSRTSFPPHPVLLGYERRLPVD